MSQLRIIQRQMPFIDFPTMGINILHTSPITQQKLCHNFMTLMNFLKGKFSIIFNIADQYQQKYSLIAETNTCTHYKR